MRWSREVLLARLLAERYPSVESLVVERFLPVPPKPGACGRAVERPVHGRLGRAA